MATERRVIVFGLTAAQVLEAVKAYYDLPADATLEGMDVNFSRRELDVAVSHPTFRVVRVHCETPMGAGVESWKRGRDDYLEKP